MHKGMDSVTKSCLPTQSYNSSKRQWLMNSTFSWHPPSYQQSPSIHWIKKAQFWSHPSTHHHANVRVAHQKGQSHKKWNTSYGTRQKSENSHKPNRNQTITESIPWQIEGTSGLEHKTRKSDTPLSRNWLCALTWFYETKRTTMRKIDEINSQR